MSWRGWLTILGVALIPQVATAQTHLVVVSGLGGEPGYSATFHEWATTLIQAATDEFGVPSSRITYLAEDPARAPGLIDGPSRRDDVESAIKAVAGRADPNDRIFIVLIGHGSDRGDRARFNLPGPDMTAADFAALLELFPTQRIVFVNTTSASGGFIPSLSGPDRTVITATRTGRERHSTVFGRYFVEAFVDAAGDTDKDGRVSALEAFEYARQQVARSYEEGNRLRTEHALLDDNGDGVGSLEPDPEGGDGALASAMVLVGPRAVHSAAADAPAPDDPELAGLLERKRELEERIAELRAMKDAMEAEAYERELETLLLDLARVSRAIREREGGEQP